MTKQVVDRCCRQCRLADCDDLSSRCMVRQAYRMYYRDYAARRRRSRYGAGLMRAAQRRWRMRNHGYVARYKSKWRNFRRRYGLVWT